MEPGAFFGGFYLGGALIVAFAIIVRGIRRGLRDQGRWLPIATITSTLLALWGAATYFMLFYVFEVMWMVAHTRPRPEGPFPEGATPYAVVGSYLAIGAVLATFAGGRRRTQQALH
jgi:hypothetical protein